MGVRDDVIARHFALGAVLHTARLSRRVSRWSTRDRGDVAVKVFEGADRAAGSTEAAVLAGVSAVVTAEDPVRVQRLIAGPFTDDEAIVVVTAWEPGQQRRVDELAIADWSALGRALAALHRALDGAGLDALTLTEPARVQQHLDLDVERGRVDEQRRRAFAKDHGAHDRYFARRLQLLEAHGAIACRGTTAPSGVIHNDYNVYNYLFVDERPPLVLDFDRAARAPRLFEIVRCLNHLPLVSEDAARAFVGSYVDEAGSADVFADVDAVAWAVSSSLLAHATKHWVTLRWLDAAGDDALFDGSASLVDAFFDGAADRSAALVEFFAGVGR